MSSAKARVAQLSNHLTNKGSIFGAGVGPGQLLKGETVIITGSGNGIGKSAAILAAAHGANVVVSDLDPKRTQETVDIITKEGGSAIGVPGDVTAKDFPDKIVKAAVEKFGKINHIVNNAGFTADKMMHTMSDDLFQLMLDVHCVAPFRLVRAAAPYLRIKDVNKQENRSIVNISSVSGTRGNAGQANYSTAKAGVTGLTKTLCKELGPFSVRCNSIAYGSIDTRLTRAKEGGEKITVGGKTVDLGIPSALRGDPGAANSTVPLRRQGTPDEAASAIIMLLSPFASYMTGQILEVDGGAKV